MKEKGDMRAGDDKVPAGSESGGTTRGNAAAGPAAPSAGLFKDEPTGTQASPDFLSTYGEDTTDVVEGGPHLPASYGPKLERQFILTVVAGPQTGFAQVVDGDEMVLGRGYGSDLLLADQGLSRRHCRIWKSDDGMCIEDLGSANGTFVDGEPVVGPRRLPEGARIHVGRHTLLTLSRQDPLEHEAARQLFQSSMRDPLTDLYNRRFFDQRLREEFAFASRHNTALSVILLDLDHFKQVNDSYGHPAGDQVLAELAKVVFSTIRVEDVFARVGGEEFSIICRGADLLQGKIVAERIRAAVERHKVTWGDRIIPLTVSVGVAAVPSPSIKSPIDFIAAVDEMLYQAKRSGRNRVCLWNR